MWIILFNALDDFGVKEINEATRMGASASSIAHYTTIDAAKRKLADEALHGALRISALVNCRIFVEFESLLIRPFFL